jgi:hypothetical protein
MEHVEFTNAQKLACIEREIKMRERVYPRFVENSKMTRQKADEEIALMHAIAEDYRAAAEKERLL